MLLYDGVPVESISFEDKFLDELRKLKTTIAKLESEENLNYQYWTMKLARVNDNLEEGQVKLSVKNRLFCTN